LLGAWLGPVAVLSARPVGGAVPPTTKRRWEVTRIAQLEPTRVTVGVDTHGDVQVAVALDQLGRRIEQIELATLPRRSARRKRAMIWSR
jgi:hypothetical protein